MDGDAKTPAHELYHQGLRNLHAEKTQALAAMENQVDHYGDYPELAAGIRKHMDATKVAQEGLKSLLDKHGTSNSGLKETVTGIVGTVASTVHAVMKDEPLKNTFATYAMEAHAVAAYSSLITMAEAVGATQDVTVLRQGQQTDEAMIKFLEGQIAPVTRKYMQVETAQKAS